MFLRCFRDSGVEESSLTQNLSKLKRRVQENALLASQLQTFTSELESRNNLRETCAGLAQAKESAAKLSKKQEKDMQRINKKI